MIFPETEIPYAVRRELTWFRIISLIFLKDRITWRFQLVAILSTLKMIQCI
jgi:hypothetical protein